MEGSPKHQEKPYPPLYLLPPSATIPSPTTTTGPVQKPPLSPRPIIRSEPDCSYPTTFVQVDPSTFKQVVQKLTGSSDPATLPHSKPNTAPHPIPPLKTVTPKKPQPGFRLYERRNSLKKLSLNPVVPRFPVQPSPRFSPRKPDILSPSLLDFPSLTLSPVTPLMADPFAYTPPALDMEAEERAIKEKGFFLHPSPRGSAVTPEPRLLPLFPVTSPRRVSG